MVKLISEIERRRQCYKSSGISQADITDREIFRYNWTVGLG